MPRGWHRCARLPPLDPARQLRVVARVPTAVWPSFGGQSDIRSDAQAQRVLARCSRADTESPDHARARFLDKVQPEWIGTRLARLLNRSLTCFEAAIAEAIGWVNWSGLATFIASVGGDVSATLDRLVWRERSRMQRSRSAVTLSGHATARSAPDRSRSLRHPATLASY